MRGTGSIVIVNFNSGAYLQRCLASIAEHGGGAPVVVVDNASTDGSERAAVGPEAITLLRNARNAGFATAVNQGLRAGAGPWVMVLNPDGQLTAGAVERLVKELDEHPECAIAAPQVLDEDGTVQGSVRGDPTLLTGLFGRTGVLTRLFPQSGLARQNVRTLAAGGQKDGGAVEWVSGACMLTRRDSMEAVGGFDERYFLYWEDADLCRRLRNRGFTIRYVPSARIVHRVGASSDSARRLAIRAFHQSAFRYYATHVATGPAGRAFAWLVLQARCRWKLLRARP